MAIVELRATRIIEALGRDADHLVTRAAENDLLADQRSIGTQLSPKRVAEYDDALFSRFGLVGSIEPAERGRDVEDVEEPAHRAGDDHAPRIAKLGEDTTAAGPGACGVEELAARHEIERFARPDVLVHEIHRRQVRAHDHQPRDVRRRDRMEQHGVHGAEDRRIGADPEGERQQSRGGKRRTSAELPHGVTNIAADGVEPLGALHGSLSLIGECAHNERDVLAIAEPLGRDPSRFVGRNAARDVVSDELLEVEADLVVHLGPDVGAPEAEIPPPFRRRRVCRVVAAGDGHAGTGTAVMILVMAPAKRFQVRDSSASRRFPAAVRR
jgi:hypothetical protein